jgi:hypothetical protein
MSMGVQTLGNEDTGVVWLRIQVVDTSPAAAQKLQYNPEEQSTSTLHSSPICCIKKQKNPTIQQSLPHGNCPILFACHHIFLSIGFLTTVKKETLCALTLNLTEGTPLTMKLLHASAPRTKNSLSIPLSYKQTANSLRSAMQMIVNLV